MKATREEIFGFIGSCIFCLFLFLILYFTVLRTEIKTGEEGILVNFGTVDLSAGAFTPNRGTPQTETKTPEPAPVVPATPQIPKPQTPPITQNLEETAAIEAAKQQKKEQERIEAEQRAARAKAEEEQRKRAAISQQVSGAFGAASSNQSQQGTGQTGNGIQGNPESTSATGSPVGGGYGEFNLGGRTLGPGGLPRPAYSIQEEGRIVINITVDPQGNVIFAEVGKGTNIDNGNMRASALDAARKAKFNTISGNNNQSGTITYRYSLK